MLFIDYTYLLVQHSELLPKHIHSLVSRIACTITISAASTFCVCCVSPCPSIGGRPCSFDTRASWENGNALSDSCGPQMPCRDGSDWHAVSISTICVLQRDDRRLCRVAGKSVRSHVTRERVAVVRLILKPLAIRIFDSNVTCFSGVFM